MSEQATATPIAPADQTKAEAPRARSESDGKPRWAGLTRGQLAGLAAVVLVAQTPFFVYLLRGEAAVTAQVPFADDFERGEIGPHYFATGGHWRIENGVLHSPGSKNNPLWLQAQLPGDVAVEFDVRSEANEGDIKCEIFGNGRDHASGYVIVFGGWSNSTSVLARLDEHGRDRKENKGIKVTKGKTYRMKLQRKGTLLQWYSDGALMMEWDDAAPLRGSGHDRFGFSSWEADLYFDNLKVTPL
ncbi:MAG: hypothetical protein HY901_06235 [Deltaproteobacteria bacterium]|nr:hypothetical protein [Deltaproteobacteria bacterium]